MPVFAILRPVLVLIWPNSLCWLAWDFEDYGIVIFYALACVEVAGKPVYFY